MTLENKIPDDEEDIEHIDYSINLYKRRIEYATKYLYSYPINTNLKQMKIDK